MTGMPKNPPWTSEAAAEAGRKGAIVREANRKARLANPALAVKQDLASALPDLVKDLLAAARGNPPFEELAPDKRLAALFKALEYAAGRPTTVEKTVVDPGPASEEGDGTERPGGIEFA